MTAAGREHNGLDFVAHHAYPVPEYGEDTLAECAEWWDRAGIVEDRGLLTICFFGMLASGFDFEPVMMGLRRMGNRAPEIRLIICGEGRISVIFSAPHTAWMVCISRAMCRGLT